jgi:hypothetical protein
MKTNREHVTMDDQERVLLEKYEAQFGETPPVAFLDPIASKSWSSVHFGITALSMRKMSAKLDAM